MRYARLYDPTEGRILLEGIDLKEYDLADLRLNVGIIFQDYLRYQMTFAQNIAVGNISQQNNRPLIEASAKQSLADTLAAKLPGHGLRLDGVGVHHSYQFHPQALFLEFVINAGVVLAE